MTVVHKVRSLHKKKNKKPQTAPTRALVSFEAVCLSKQVSQFQYFPQGADHIGSWGSHVGKLSRQRGMRIEHWGPRRGGGESSASTKQHHDSDEPFSLTAQHARLKSQFSFGQWILMHHWLRRSGFAHKQHSLSVSTNQETFMEFLLMCTITFGCFAAKLVAHAQKFSDQI